MFLSLFASVMISLMSFLPAPAMAQAGRNTIEGRITTSDNRPVENVRVFLNLDGPLAQTTTDGSGRYQFRRLRRGTYNVEVDPAGTDYGRQNQRVEINAPDLAGTGGADFYRADFVLKVDRVGKREDQSPTGVVFYQNIPAPAKEAFKLGDQSLEKNDLRNAEVSLLKAIELFPDYYDALEKLGSMYVRYAQYDAGLPLLGHAVQVNPRGWQAYYSLGVALLESKRRKEGLDALESARVLNAESININMRLGLELAKDEQGYDRAIKSLTKVTEVAGKRLPDAYLALASIYGKRKQYDQEAKSLEGYLLALPDAPQREAIRSKIIELRQKAKAGSAS
jgi:tetratricopeptide (TPR) repeat protein